MIAGGWKRLARDHWGWFAIGVMAGVAVWHALDFSDAPDADFPKVVRPHFNAYPPAAYRLAEPGDTLDRIALYLAAGALAISLAALVRIAWGRRFGSSEGWGLWPASASLGIAATWYASTPGPTFDGWHGLGWRTVLDPMAPILTRSIIALAGLILAAVSLVNFVLIWPDRRAWWTHAVEARVLILLGFALIMVALRQVEIPGLEPAGYWPRCCLDLGFLAFALALLRLQPAGEHQVSVRSRLTVVGTWALIVVGGIAITVLHRPIARLRPVVPGRIYISAMPSYRGLAIEQQRLGFKTIINLFDEASTQASPLHNDEIRFVREHGLRYLGSPSDGLESDRFLDETFALAQNPDAWPILVHCHGCMDRSPAWMGMYRFLVEHKPLAGIFAEIERHRGTRPKAVVTLQYNRKLPKRAPEQFANDPTAAILLRAAEGTKDPFHLLDWNPTRTDRQVVRRIEPDATIRRP